MHLSIKIRLNHFSVQIFIVFLPPSEKDKKQKTEYKNKKPDMTSRVLIDNESDFLRLIFFIAFFFLTYPILNALAALNFVLANLPSVFGPL